ncbi:LppX_LprAFG lipoprotein [Mycolicibacterium bacteremicum]|uniref:LppX_LprAFG lipoprotein n=1 Tax=Mycolicibacterium bacteremicum TaxID=564198 RepID=UPI0026EF6B0A|nr:LppX_LprAFG lipoprotein [Mycolicibacterium bacteremicum]
MQTRPRAVRVLLPVLAAIMALAFVGCSSKTDDAPLPDAATLLTESAATTRSQQSVHLELAVGGEIKELPIASLSGDLTNAPAVAAQGSADLIFLGQKLTDVGFVVVDGDLYGAITKGGNMQNFGPAADIYDISAILNPDNGLANVLSSITDPKAEGREAIGGSDAVKITGTVSAEAINKIAPQLNATAPAPATAWIREDGDHQLAQVMIEPSAGNTITMTLSDWGKEVTVTKPAT